MPFRLFAFDRVHARGYFFASMRGGVAISCSIMAVILCADLPEVRKLLGVVGCPDCQPDAAAAEDADAAAPTIPRTTEAVQEVLSEAVDTMIFGRITDARAVMTAAGLSWTHTESACPMLHLLHFRFLSFPGDRLHLT